MIMRGLEVELCFYFLGLQFGIDITDTWLESLDYNVLCLWIDVAGQRKGVRRGLTDGRFNGWVGQ